MNSAAYMSQTHVKRLFTISEVAADWHEQMILQRIMQPSVAALTNNLTRGAARIHTTTPVSYARPYRPVVRKLLPSFPVPLRVGG